MKEDCGNVFNIPLFDVRICLLSLGGMRFGLCHVSEDHIVSLWACVRIVAKFWAVSAGQ